MNTFNSNHKDYADLDALLDFAYSAKARKRAERARNCAIGSMLAAATPSRTSGRDVATCNQST